LNGYALAAGAWVVHQRRLAMRTFMKWALVLLVPAVFATSARPAEPDAPEGTTVKLLLLRQKSVQKELELTPESIKKIIAFTHAESEKAAKALELAEPARKEAFEKLRKENAKFLADTLNAKQSKRLDQITMQFTALTQLTKPEMVRELKLSDDQVKKFKELQSEARKAVVELIEAKEHKGKSEKLAKLRAETRKKILAVLTDDQKAKVREIAGPPFEGEIVFEEAEAPKDK
jgi:Spy/CpxP family protein refolding chaperone